MAMLTQRSRYGLRAMLLLAKEAPGAPPVPMSRIAGEANVPRKFLEIILTELKGANLVTSTRGKQGGFHLARPPHLISFGDIIRVIEGPLALVPCVSRTAYKRCKDCQDEATCEIRRAMLVVRDDTARILDGRSLADAVVEELEAAE
jgi:Rrf2 family protein